MGAKITFNLKGTGLDVKGLGRTTRPIFKKIMESHRRSVEYRFDTESGVDGRGWKKLVPKKSYEDAAFYPKGKRKLQGPEFEIDKNGIWKMRPFDMKLKGSLQFVYTKNKFEISSPRKYAQYHEFGSNGGRIPKRSFMGLSKAQENKYKGMIIEGLTKYAAKKIAATKKNLK